MKAVFRSSFAHDLRKLKDRSVKRQVQEIIETIEAAESLQGIANVKKLSVGDRYYRIRIGDYRISLTLEDDAVVFVRILHRRDIYRYFP